MFRGTGRFQVALYEKGLPAPLFSGGAQELQIYTEHDLYLKYFHGQHKYKTS